MSGLGYIGSKISLISKAKIRYEGILLNINASESTVVLQNVKSYGTEHRDVARFVPPKESIYEHIIFRADDILDIEVCEPNSETTSLFQEDSAIVSASQSGSLALPYSSSSAAPNSTSAAAVAATASAPQHPHANHNWTNLPPPPPPPPQQSIYGSVSASSSFSSSAAAFNHHQNYHNKNNPKSENVNFAAKSGTPSSSASSFSTQKMSKSTVLQQKPLNNQHTKNTFNSQSAMRKTATTQSSSSAALSTQNDSHQNHNHHYQNSGNAPFQYQHGTNKRIPAAEQSQQQQNQQQKPQHQLRNNASPKSAGHSQANTPSQMHHPNTHAANWYWNAASANHTHHSQQYPHHPQQHNHYYNQQHRNYHQHNQQQNQYSDQYSNANMMYNAMYYASGYYGNMNGGGGGASAGAAGAGGRATSARYYRTGFNAKHLQNQPLQRGGGSGGGSAGGGGFTAGSGKLTKPKIKLHFEEDYDFEMANAELNNLSIGGDDSNSKKLHQSKQQNQKVGEVEIKQEKDFSENDKENGTETVNDQQKTIKTEEVEVKDQSNTKSAEICYDKSKSFFDRIGSEAADKASGKIVKVLNQREERKINSETFGISSSNTTSMSGAGTAGGGGGMRRNSTGIASSRAPPLRYGPPTARNAYTASAIGGATANGAAGNTFYGGGGRAWNGNSGGVMYGGYHHFQAPQNSHYYATQVNGVKGRAAAGAGNAGAGQPILAGAGWKNRGFRSGAK